MKAAPKVLNELINGLAQFPGIGRRSAERIAFHILKMDSAKVEDLSRQIREIQKFIKPCQLCNNFSMDELCSICSDPNREKDVICIVEEPVNIFAIEKTSQYNGLYYVLLGSLSPFDGVGGEDLNISKLLNRLNNGEIKEVIVSTDADNDGELTAQFLIKRLSGYKIKIYRIGIGIPLGTQIEYIDSATLGKALQERKAIV